MGVAAAGETITVVFDEILDHPGHSRIAFDADGDDDLAPPTWDGAAWLELTVWNDQLMPRAWIPPMAHRLVKQR